MPVTGAAERARIHAPPRSAATSSAGVLRDPAPVLWRLAAAAAAPPLGEALRIAESIHVAVLALAGRRFGADAIPPVLSGRGEGGAPLRGPRQHLHKHILVGSSDGGSRIEMIAVWAPLGLTAEEREVVSRLHLRHRGGHIPLERTERHPAFARARTWRTLTPYLPFNHVKPRGRSSVEGQVRRELVEFRGLPNPESVRCMSRIAGGAHLQRSRGRGRGEPPPRPHELRITFAEPLSGPMALGRHAHFSLGVLVPAE
jgi:CRISPR-associated protein Csb2